MVLRIDTAVLHSTGGRAYNEDAWGQLAHGEVACWVVCDGAGGHGGGDVASRLAIEHALRCWNDRVAQAGPPAATTAATLQAAVAAADRAVHDGQRHGDAVADMRTTLVMLALDLQQGDARWVHVGDSRVYQFHGGRLAAQTRDHSLVQQLLQAGLVQGDVSREHPRRNVLTAALGGGLSTDGTPVGAAATPLQAGDAFLLCTDGFWEYVLEDEMAGELAVSQDAGRTLAVLEEVLRARARSGHDNYTAILIRLLD